MNMNKMVLTNEEIVFLLETHFSTKFNENCMEKFTEKFNAQQPNKTSILQLKCQFRKHGTVMRVPYMPHARTELTPANVMEVGDNFQATPSAVLL